MFKFDVKLTEQDYQKFNFFNSQESKFGKKLILIWRVSFLVILLIAIAFFIDRNGVDITTLISLIPLIIIGVVFVVFTKPFLRFSTKKGIKMLEKKGKKLYSPVYTAEFFDDYLVETTTEIESKVKYTALDSAYIVRNEDIYIYINIQQAVILPRASFESQEQWDSFLEFIESKIDKVYVIE